MNAKTTITVKTGTEGPRHDPYAYEEITVTRQDGHKATAHVGLGEYVDATLPDGTGFRVHAYAIGGDAAMLDAFERIAGITIDGARHALNKLARARRRGHRSHGGTAWVEGFPGESFERCKCGTILESSFNPGAIE